MLSSPDVALLPAAPSLAPLLVLPALPPSAVYLIHVNMLQPGPAWVVHELITGQRLPPPAPPETETLPQVKVPPLAY
ncbi:hypothetical protein ELE36_10540 [Pseudolysobacter antarcticus]|uniref:Uncharacterized protein n=1 Tax=Pseudolysobacter antarcticus TaxID=2511995 RepID=A0A411HJT5_9GAMM|nr:hypothetical protein ELE36_10540 [Pseudolysobacter antarcticus]